MRLCKLEKGTARSTLIFIKFDVIIQFQYSIAFSSAKIELIRKVKIEALHTTRKYLFISTFYYVHNSLLLYFIMFKFLGLSMMTIDMY